MVVTFHQVSISTSAPLTITACIDGRCGSQTFRGFHKDSLARGWFVEVPTVPADADVRVSVKAVANSRVIFNGSTTAHTRKFQPNGPDCDPTVWRVDLAAHGKTRLTS